MFIRTASRVVASCTVIALSSAVISPHAAADCATSEVAGPECLQLDPITIFGTAIDARDVAGGASVISHQDLEEFENSDVLRALRRVPGVSVQLEDGWGLRPNISIRGTATERSSRITLMEDSVLIAPAPYSAPSAYYFPTFGRINTVEVLKGPASITEGPYTVGGAVNLRSTLIPQDRSGFLQGEYGSDDTWRVHGWYGDSDERMGFVVETHQWQSDGYQSIDRSDNKTGLDKQDYLAKLAFYSDPAASLYQSLEIKLQKSEEDSQQSYLGLTDTDFEQSELRRYGLSALDEMHNEHDQVTVSWRLENQQGSGLTVTAYNNNFERAWYKTEGLDFDGSENPESFNRTSWSNIVQAINLGESLGGLTAGDMQAILDGADTAPGAIQIRNNAREYYSRGIQVVGNHTTQWGSSVHSLQAGLRYHEDEEDRLQRNDNYQQTGGQLVLNQAGLEGNAGNQVQDARAWAVYFQDRIDLGNWTLTPGLRYENILLSRDRYFTDNEDPSSRDPANFRDNRENRVKVWLPGMGGIYQLNSHNRLVGGIHRGFAVPGNEPGIDPEESTNYEFGWRHDHGRYTLEVMGFFNDYENLVGLCTNSSGSDCIPGQAFNGKGVYVSGLELSLQKTLETASGWQIPLQLAYTWMNAEFQSDFESDFFGSVQKGDPVPYIPDHQVWAAAGILHGAWSINLSANYVDAVCTRASCGVFEKTESALILDLSVHYDINRNWQAYAVLENLTDEIHIAAREPYGARPNKPQTLLVGMKFQF